MGNRFQEGEKTIRRGERDSAIWKSQKWFFDRRGLFLKNQPVAAIRFCHFSLLQNKNPKRRQSTTLIESNLPIGLSLQVDKNLCRQRVSASFLIQTEVAKRQLIILFSAPRKRHLFFSRRHAIFSHLDLVRLIKRLYIWTTKNISQHT